MSGQSDPIKRWTLYNLPVPLSPTTSKTITGLWYKKTLLSIIRREWDSNRGPSDHEPEYFVMQLQSWLIKNLTIFRTKKWEPEMQEKIRFGHFFHFFFFISIFKPFQSFCLFVDVSFFFILKINFSHLITSCQMNYSFKIFKVFFLGHLFSLL